MLEDCERAALDRDGFVLLERVVDPVRLEAMRVAFETAARDVDRSSGTRHVRDLSAPAFGAVDHERRVRAAMAHVLGESLVLRDAHGRDPLPGFGQQGLHTDAVPRPTGARFTAATALWLLDDFTFENGATRVVPGTHVRTGAVPKAYAAPLARHPDEHVVVAPAGSVLAINGHVWHSGRRNGSKGPRRVIQCAFVVPQVARGGL